MILAWWRGLWGSRVLLSEVCTYLWEISSGREFGSTYGICCFTFGSASLINAFMTNLQSLSNCTVAFADSTSSSGFSRSRSLFSWSNSSLTTFNNSFNLVYAALLVFQIVISSGYFMGWGSRNSICLHIFCILLYRIPHTDAPTLSPCYLASTNIRLNRRVSTVGNSGPRAKVALKRLWDGEAILAHQSSYILTETTWSCRFHLVLHSGWLLWLI